MASTIVARRRSLSLYEKPAFNDYNPVNLVGGKSDQRPNASVRKAWTTSTCDVTADMANFLFHKIDIPGGPGTNGFVYISVDGVDSMGLAVGNYGDTLGDWHGFTAVENGPFATYDPPSSSNNTDVLGITGTGEIYGDYTDWTNRQHGFVVNNGVTTTIDYPFATATNISGATASGELFGSYVDDLNVVNGFIDNNGTFTTIDDPVGLTTSVTGVNASGVMVGAITDKEYVGHAFADNDGIFTTLNPPGSYSSSAVGVTASGEVVGDYEDVANNQYGFIYNNGAFTQIAVAGSTENVVSYVGDAGEFVGYYVDASGHVHGFVDQNGTIATIDVPGSTETEIMGVNAAGEIYGDYNDSLGQHGFVGTPPPKLIEAAGVTSLVEVGSVYFLNPVAGGTGPELFYDSAPVTDGMWAGWTPVGAEQTANGYDIAWENAADGLFNIWSTDSNGNYLATMALGVSGASLALDNYETIFHQDLNGDGTIGPLVIESAGSTSLVQVGSEYYLTSIAGGTGPELFYNGAPVTQGMSAGWAPVAAEITTSGYDVAFYDTSNGQFNIWSTDNNGNYLATIALGISGASSTLENYETIFHQDLNGDGTIGPASPTVIEAAGVTSLVQVGANYYLNPGAGGSGPELIYGNAPVVPNMWTGWAPVGAEQTATGYDVVWQNVADGLFNVWSTDSNGNYLATVALGLSVTSSALENYETIFHQDLNGDGTIGLPPLVIESSGATSLVQVGSDYFLDPVAGGTGPELIYNGAPVTADMWAGWALVGAEQTASGYDVAFKNAALGLFNVWSTDSNGNYLSTLAINLSGTGTSLENYETILHQDLNGDGSIGVPTTSSFSLQYKGFDYVAFYNGAYEDSDSLPSLMKTGANSIEATLDYGIDVATSQVVADQNYTDSLTALGNTIAQAESLGLSVMVRPLIDFLNPTEIAPYSVGDWRQDYQPTNVAAFFASYQQMIVQEAEVAQANGAQMLSIGAELDQLAGPQYLPYWIDIITAVRQVFSGALTYSASWDTASEVSFWSQLNYEGIDNYVPLSNAQNPTLQNLVNGWLEPATASTNPGAYAVIGNQSPIEYFENLAAQSGKPLLFTELGYANDSGAAADPSASGNSPDPALQADLYQAFFQAWTQSKSSALVGAYFWEWDPNGSTSNVGPNIDSFSPQNSPAQSAAMTGFEAVSSSDGTHLALAAVGSVGLTVAAGAVLELTGTEAGTTTFMSSTGTLKLDAPQTFTGQIQGFSGNGTLAGSDHVDLLGLTYNSSTQSHSTYNSSTGILSVNNGTTVDLLHFTGSYSLANFEFASDGNGGTIVYDPPTIGQAMPGAKADDSTIHITGSSTISGSADVDSGHVVVDRGATLKLDNVAAPGGTITNNGTIDVANHSVVSIAAGVGQDNFIFAANFGQVTITHFEPGTDSIQIDHAAFANLDAFFAAMHDDSRGNAVITDAAHDIVTLQNVTAAQMLAHHDAFHIV